MGKWLSEFISETPKSAPDKPDTASEESIREPQGELEALTEEFTRTGRIFIWPEPLLGGAWLVRSYEDADDIREGAVYSKDVWPDFVKLDPEHKLHIHEFLCGIGGGRLAGIERHHSNNEDLW